MNNQVVNYEYCLVNGVYTFVAIDGSNNGWTNGSTFQLLNDQDAVILAGTLDRYSRYEWSFFPSYLVSPAATWKYTTTAQSGTSWAQSSFSDASWSSYAAGSFPEVSSVTRYYRTTSSFPLGLSPSKFAGYLLAGYTVNEGIIMYVNGKEVYRYNLPASSSSSTTASDASATEGNYKMVSGSAVADLASGTITVAIEVHAASATPSGADTFKGYLFGLYGDCAFRSHGGSASSNHPNDWASQQMPNLWDGDLQTAWYFNGVPAYNQYTFANGRRELITKYIVRNSNNVQRRDPKTWELLGSNDGNTWVRLDYQDNVVFSVRRTSYEVELPNNKVAYNMIRINIINVYSQAEGEIAEVEFYTCNKERLDDTLKYSQTTYSFTTNLEEINILPYTTGFANFNINPALPAGLSFNQDTGRISGTPTAAATNTHTITAVYAPTNAQSTFTLTLTITDCPSSNVRVDFKKVTSASGLGGIETWSLYNSMSQMVYQHISVPSDASSITTTKKFCIPASYYRIEATDQYSSGWSTNSYLEITLYYRTFTYPITRLILRDKISETFYVNLAFVNPTGMQGLIGTQPTSDWKTNAGTPTGFTNYSWDTAGTATAAQSVWYFRQTYNIAASDLTNGQIFEYRFRVRAGTVVYLDGTEIYRANLPAGEVTPTTVATDGRAITEDPWWRSVSGNLNTLQPGNHIFAVAVAHKTGFAQHLVDFDSNLRILMDTDKISHTWRMNAAESSTCWGDSTKATKLFDGLYSTTFVAYHDATHLAPRYGQGTYQEWRAELINKYCVVSGYDGPQYDPKSWMLQGSNDGVTFDTLSTVNNVQWNYRSQALCFYMPNQNKAYRTYRLEVTELLVPNPDNDRFVIGELELYSLDYSKIVVPALTYSTNTIVGYVGAQLSATSPTSVYYYGFTANPSLPAGVLLNSGTGDIYGIPTTVASGTYTISATGPNGSTQTTITLNISNCGGNNVLFSMTFSGMGSTSTQNGFELYSPSNQLLDKYEQFPGALTTWYTSYCVAVGLYKLILKDGPNDGWGDGLVTVRDNESNTILTATCNFGEAPKTVYINLAHLVHAKNSSWKYTSTTPEATWYVPSYNDATWSTAMPGQFVGLSGTVQYYRINFPVTDISLFAFYELTITTTGGVAAYLNGKKIYVDNLPADFTSNSYAVNQYTESRVLATSNSVKFGELIVGSNTLAIEIHRHSQGSVDGAFSASLIMQLPNENRIIDGIASSNYRGLESDNYNEIYTNAFDGNINTKYYSNVCGNNTYLQWTYNNNRREYINSYSVTRGNNADRLISELFLYGSNDGTNFDLLDTRTGLTWGAFNSAAGKKTFDFFTKNSYNTYRLEMFSSSCKAGYEVSEFTLGSKVINSYCPAQYGYPDTIDNVDGIKACPSYYSGQLTRFCSGGVWGNEVNNCELDAPLPIVYATRALIFYTDKTTASPAPLVRAAEATISIDPALPAGLSIDSISGIISGRASAVFNTTDFTVTTTNSKGSASAIITLSAIQAGELSTGWIVLIVIAIIIVVIFIAVIVFCVVNRQKGRKNGHRKIEKTKAGKAAPKKDAEKKVRV